MYLHVYSELYGPSLLGELQVGECRFAGEAEGIISCVGKVLAPHIDRDGSQIDRGMCS